MKNLTAKEARMIASGDYKEELEKVLSEILLKAKKGETWHYIYDPISNYTVKEIESRGFSIDKAIEIANQRDSLYYTIRW